MWYHIHTYITEKYTCEIHIKQIHKKFTWRIHVNHISTAYCTGEFSRELHMLRFFLYMVIKRDKSVSQSKIILIRPLQPDYIKSNIIKSIETSSWGLPLSAYRGIHLTPSGVPSNTQVSEDANFNSDLLWHTCISATICQMIMSTCQMSENVVICMAITMQKHVLKIFPKKKISDILSSHHKDLSSQHNYPTTGGRNMPP